MRSLSLFLLCLPGCAHPGPPPSLWSDSLPVIETLPEQEMAPTVDSCPGPAPLIAGQPAPFVDEGLATCQALILPEHEVAQVIARARIREYWEGLARLEHQGRIIDRMTANEAWSAAIQARQGAERDARRVRVALPLAAIAGVLAGAILGSFGAWLGAEMVAAP